MKIYPIFQGVVICIVSLSSLEIMCLVFILSFKPVMKISNKVNGNKYIPKSDVHLINIIAYFLILNLYKALANCLYTL